jgi:hypothetical protein
MPKTEDEDTEALVDIRALEEAMNDRHMGSLRFCTTALTMVEEVGRVCPDVRANLQQVVRLLLDRLAQQGGEPKERGPRDDEGDDLQAIQEVLKKRGLDAEQSCTLMLSLVVLFWRTCPDQRKEISTTARVVVDMEPGLLGLVRSPSDPGQSARARRSRPGEN